MNSFLKRQDANGQDTDVIPLASHGLVVKLSAGMARSISLPAGARTAVFSATGNFWVRADALPALPAGDILDGSGPELNPVARDVEPVSSLGLVAPADCLVSIGLYL